MTAPDLPPPNQLRDPLTQAYSRAAFQPRLREAMDHARRYNRALALMVLDIDHFKSVNDAFGHARGDDVLAEAAHRLRETIRTSDILFRYGGDEFILLLPDTTNPNAVLLGQRLLEAVRDTPFAGDPPLTFTLSVGIASYPADASSPEGVFQVADQRLYQAKRLGRARVVGDDASTLRPTVISELSRLLERDLALEMVQTCLRELDVAAPLGAWCVAGPQGAGHTRFLNEARKMARMRGYATLEVSGSPALAWRELGALAEAQTDWADAPSPHVGATAWSAAWRAHLLANQRHGLLITLNNTRFVDRETLDFLRQVTLNGQIEHLGVFYDDTRPAQPRPLWPDQAPRIVIPLAPLSLEGVRVWLRHSMQWEAPTALAEWLHHATQGLPGRLRAGVDHLLQRQAIAASPHGWQARPDLALHTLAEQVTAPPAPWPTTLPDMGLNLIGRETELHALKKLLTSAPLITLTGVGGMGKTRLALQAAAECANLFPDGVVYLTLTSLYTPEQWLASLAHALRTPTDWEAVHHTLHSRATLLVLDNFDTLRETATPTLATLLTVSPHLVVLITCRERLGLSAEQVLELDGLPVPPTEDVPDPTRYAAVRLFCQRARHIEPDFDPTRDDWPHVVRLCRLVLGLPLGLELAAAWVSTFTPADIADEIEQGIGLLSTRRPEVPERHRSVFALFDAFWRLLGETEQATLSRLSVFQGPFTSEAARAVAEASPFFLDALAAKTYVRRTGPRLYAVHELVRQYAAERILPSEEREARERHSRFYLNWLASQHADSPWAHQQQDNLRAAQRWTNAH